MKRNEAIRFVVLRSLGNFLVLFSLYGVVATFGPALTAEAKFLIIQARGVTFTVPRVAQVPQVPRGQGNAQTGARGTRDTSATRDTLSNDTSGRDLGFADVLAGSKNQILTPKDPLFSILIPKIGASAKVFPNVDPDNPDIFLPVLQQGIAHAKGSVFPGHPGNTYLFAHSTDNWWDAGRYNAVFYTLGNLSENDEIIVFFENRRYDYVVTQKIIADPQDVTLLTAPHTGEQRLVLQTCWPPGTTWKRLYVIAKPK